MTVMDTITTVYVKALSNGAWFGGWAPVKARQEWLRADRIVGLFTLVQEGLDDDDEYEYFQPGSVMIGLLDGEVYKVVTGIDTEDSQEQLGSNQ